MKLTDGERLILFNQYEILKKTNPEECKEYEEYQEIVASGFKGEYKRLYVCFENELDEIDCNFVCDVLNMFNSIRISYFKLEDEDQQSINKIQIAYGGFYSVTERELLRYANYILNKDEGKEELQHQEWFNRFAYKPMKDTYKKMLAVWKQYSIKERNMLTVDQIQALIKENK